MPIVISHQPPMELLARAGWYAGAGAYRQEQEEMQQRERMQIRGIEANLLSQQISYQQQMQRDAWGAQVDAQRQGAQQQHQQDMLTRQQEMQQKLAEIRQQERQEALQAKLQNQKELSASKFRNEIEWDQAKHFYGESDDVSALIREQLADGYDFETPQQRQEYENKMAEIAKLRNDPTLREIQKAQGIYEIATRMPIPSKRIPTTEEQMREQMVEIPHPNNPNKKLLIAPDRDGNPRLIAGDEAEKADTSAQDELAKEESFKKEYSDAKKLLTKRTDGGTVFPSHEEIMDHLEAQSDYADMKMGRKKEQPAQQEPEPAPVKKQARRLKYDPETGTVTRG